MPRGITTIDAAAPDTPELFRIGGPGAKPSEIIKALNHPFRRASLRFLLESGPASTTEIAVSISQVSDNNLRFHLDLLVTSGLASKEKRVGLRENLYSPTDITRTSWVAAALKLTAGED